MTLLPIAERELRVAARKPGTLWLRLVAVMAALVFGSGALLISVVTGAGAGTLGSGLFSTLTSLCLVVALAAGVFFTSDSLSEEKREGTLGLLFLTDLRGYDVVLGKLLATSLRGSFALMAVFPVLAITLLLGGVTGIQLWRTVLAIVNALSFSLVIGLFVSVLSRDSQRALAGTVGLLILSLAAGPLADRAIAEARGQSFTPILSLASPGYVFAQAGPFQSQFWLALGVNQLVVSSLLALTCWRAPRCWMDGTARSSSAWQHWENWLKFGGNERRGRLRSKLLDANPARWLAARERWQALAAWFLAGTAAAILVGIMATGSLSELLRPFGVICGSMTVVLYLWTASQAGRLFVDARRNGFLEMLLATPLTSHQLASGLCSAIKRSFGPPVILLVGLSAFVRVCSPHDMLPSGAGMAGNLWITRTVIVAVGVLGSVATLANFVALAWFGLWAGLNSRSAPLATIKTLLWVQVVGSIAVYFAAILTVPVSLLMALLLEEYLHLDVVLSTAGLSPFFLVSSVKPLLEIAKDVVFIRWARRRLSGDLRDVVLRTSTQVTLPVMPPVIRAPAKP